MNKKIIKAILQFILIVFIIGVVVWVNDWVIKNEFTRELTKSFGYPGIFLASVVSGFNLLVPVPIVGFFPFFIEVGFHPIFTVLTIAAGMTVGDALGYLVGRVARNAADVSHVKMITRIKRISEKYPWSPMILMFLYAGFVPLPNEILVVPLSFLGYRWRWIMLAVFLGNVIFNFLAAYGIFHLTLTF